MPTCPYNVLLGYFTYTAYDVVIVDSEMDVVHEIGSFIEDEEESIAVVWRLKLAQEPQIARASLGNIYHELPTFIC